MGRLEQKDIRYRGYSTLPDDYQVADGGIAFATNAVYEDGGLKVLQEAKPLELLVAGGARIYIHHTVNYYHYIIVYEFGEGDEKYVRLYVVDKKVMEDWLAVEGNEWVDAIYHIGGEGDMPANMTEGVVDFLYRCEGAFVSLVAVANTLVVSTEEEMYYFLCKPGGVDDGQAALTSSCEHEYIFLGNKVPSVEVEFGLGLTVLEKTYTNTGLTKSVIKDGESLSDEKIGDTEEHYSAEMRCVTTIAGVSLASDENKFDEEVKLEAQHVYVLWIANGASIKNVTLHGTVEGSGPVGVQDIATSSGFYRFVSGYDYGDLYVTWEKNNDNARGGMAFIGDTHRTLSSSETGSGGSLDPYFVDMTEDNYTAILGCINKFVADYGTDKNRFIHPFFVRYAVRMYDSSVCELSVPILMCPNSGYAPIVESNEYDDDVVKGNLNLYAFVADLEYRLLASIDKMWKDIIQSVDIYVSPPIYPYKEGADYVSDDNMIVEKKYCVVHNTSYDNVFYTDVAFLSYGIGKVKDATGRELLDDYTYNNLTAVAKKMYGFCENGVTYVLQVSPKEEEEIDEEIKRESRFYLIKKVNFEDLIASEDFQDIDMEDGVLEGLAGREALSEDMVGYMGFVGSGLYSYNQRLHTFGGELTYRDIAEPLLQMQHIGSPSKDFLWSDNDVKDDFTLSAITFTDAWVYINTEDGVKVEHTTFSSWGGVTAGFIWFFYPNNRAYKLVIGAVNYGPYAFDLSEHEFLNGAYYFARVQKGYFGKTEKAPDDYGKYPQASISSKSIYVSEVNNPFVFRNSSAVTVGSGKILSLSSAAQAMSQGQFGEYPLYAFTDEGIWALSVQTDGTYGTSQPIARDVCTNVDSITQLDSSVLFVTDRGIMEIAGSKVACISEGIDGEWGEFNPLVLPYFAELYLKYVEGVVEGDEDYEAKKAAFEAMVNAWSEERFFNFIKTCRMVYDYVHQRILVYNGERSIGYNYSLESKEWSLMFSELRYSVNSYPEALVLEKVDDVEYGLPSDEEHWGLVNVSEYVDEGDEGDVATELFVTRPFKLDAPDVFKTVDSVVQRGYFQQSAKENHVVGSVLYGSVDLFNWEIVGQSATVEVAEGSGQYTAGHIIDKMQGSPYKYFRVAVLCRLGRRETICGCSLLYELKDNNMLR